jgi:predicted ArsR family transcriptional regulator
VARTILERGPQSAAALAEQLHLSPAAIRRHLDALVADDFLIEREPRPAAHRGRGRPARTYALTDAGRAAFPHAYDDLASTALRYLRDTGGEQSVLAFAEHRAQTLVDQLASDVDPAGSLAVRAERMARSLTTHGYASTTAETGAGVQVCQHHCPVAHVAAEFPELCEAETRTIAHGDGVCTTHVPVPPAPSGRH